MSLFEAINKDLVSAMKAQDKIVLSVLRLAKTACVNEEIIKGSELNDDEVLTVLVRMVNQRKEAALAYRQAGHEQRAVDEEAEIEIIRRYLPEQMSEDQILELVQKIIEETGAVGQSDFGKVMKAAMAQTKGKADGKLVSSIVKNQLSGQ